MKIKITIVFVLFNLFSVFSQQDLIKELGKQAVIIDSLKKVTKTEKENYRIQSEALKNKNDSIKILSIISNCKTLNTDSFKTAFELLVTSKDGRFKTLPLYAPAIIFVVGFVICFISFIFYLFLDYLA